MGFFWPMVPANSDSLDLHRMRDGAFDPIYDTLEDFSTAKEAFLVNGLESDVLAAPASCAVRLEHLLPLNTLTGLRTPDGPRSRTWLWIIVVLTSVWPKSS